MRRSREAEGRLDDLTLAESEVQLPRFVPGQTQAAAEWCMAHEAYALDTEPQHQRRVTGGPERAYRLGNVVRVRVIDALIPATRALREVGIVAHCVQHGLQLKPAALRYSREILRDYGNMSSATLMFVLDRILRDDDARGAGVGMAFGPGLTVETFAFHRP